MRITLCHCAHRTGNALSHPKVEHLGMGYLAAAARKQGDAVRIVDAHLFDWGVADTVSAILATQPQVVGFSILHTNLLITAAVMVALRRSGFGGAYVLGGYYPTFHAEDMLRALPEPAYILRGEADHSFPRLVVHLEGGNRDAGNLTGISFLAPDDTYVQTPPPPAIASLDDLPFPARDTLADVFRLRNPVLSVSPSRGCPHTCNFCSIIAFYRRSRVDPSRERSPENVLDEIELLLDHPATRQANADFVWFCADEFVGLGEEGETFADRLAAAVLRRGLIFRWEIACRVDRVNLERFRLLHAAGLRSVYLGVESFSQAALDNFHKQATVDQNLAAIEVLERLGIAYTFGTIVFGDKTRLEDIRITHEAIARFGYRHVTMPLARLKKFHSQKDSQIVPRWREFRDLLDDETFTRLYRIAYRIYDYEIGEQTVAELSQALSGVRRRSEENVQAAIELLDHRLLEPVAFWKLVFHLRDGLGKLVGDALHGLGAATPAQIRSELFRQLETTGAQVAAFRGQLEAGDSKAALVIYDRELHWDRASQPTTLAGADHFVAEQSYRRWLDGPPSAPLIL